MLSRNKTIGYIKFLERPALYLVIVVFALTILFSLLNITESFDPPYLIFSLNILLVGVPCLLLAAIAAISFARTGVWSTVWFGAGSLAFGLAVLVSGPMQMFSTTNATITAHNISTLLGGFSYLLGAFFLTNRIPAQQEGSQRLATLLQIYVFSLLFVAIIIVLSLYNFLTPFFIEGIGGTASRQVVLTADVLLFLIVSLVNFREYLRGKSKFLFWHSLGLLLIALGLVGFFLETRMGTPLNWMGRVAELSGGVYFFIAALVTLKEARGSNMNVSEALASLLTQTETRLKESEEKYRSIVETANEGIWTTDTVFKTTFVNQKLADMLGYTREECMMKTEEDFLVEEQKKQLSIAREELNKREKTEYDCRYLRKDGAILWVLVKSSPFFDSKGRHVGNIFMVTDITKRKQAEEELLQVNRELRAISDCHQVMMRATDEQMLFNDICRIICDVAGYRMAWVGSVEHDDAKSVRPIAWAGAEDGYLANANITWADTERGRGPTGMAVRTAKIHFFQDFATEPAAAPWREAALARGYRASIAIPLLDTTKNVIGVFMIYARQANSFTPAEVQLLEKLAEDLAFGINVLRDSAKREQAEAENARLASFPELNPNPIVETDLKGNITYLNPSAKRLFPELAVLGQEHPILKIMISIGSVPRGEKGEIPYFDVQCGERTYEQRIYYYAQNKLLRNYLSDITERRQVEEALTKEKTALQVTIENTNTHLAYLDPQFNFVQVNSAYARGSGYTNEELIGKNHFTLFPDKENQALFERVRDTGTPIELHDRPFVFSNQPERGVTYWDWILSPVKDASGNVEGLVLSLIDTTARKKLDELKDEFLSMISHEMRTPLTVIMGALHTVVTKEEHLPPEEKRQLLQDSIIETESLSHLLSNLLELSRAQANRLVLDRQQFNITTKIRDIVERMRDQIPSHQFLLDIPAKLPAVYADPLRLEHILHNLLENAVKYSPRGSQIKVSVKREKELLTVAVQDHGVGISSHDQEILFKPFERLGHSATESIKGTGVGLVVCKRLVEANDGHIWLESTPGQGSTFFFTLPLKKPQSDHD